MDHELIQIIGAVAGYLIDRIRILERKGCDYDNLKDTTYDYRNRLCRVKSILQEIIMNSREPDVKKGEFCAPIVIEGSNLEEIFTLLELYSGKKK